MEKMLYLQVADHIIQRIQAGSLKQDDKLSERKLAAEYNVSRAVVRESMKLLNEKGLVHTIYGKGSYVEIPDDKALISKFENVMDISRVHPSDVLEARELLENAMAPWMIERVNDQDLEVLQQLCETMESQLEDPGAFVDSDAKFHLALSICTHNRVLTIITGTLNNLANREKLLRSEEVRRRANWEHRRIVEALARRDELALLRALQSHIKCIRTHTKVAAGATEEQAVASHETEVGCRPAK